jgi:hypothetical protein
MQITNILRDVGEDFRNDRIYLPADLLQKHGISYEDLAGMHAGGELSPADCRLIDEVMAMAEQLYEKAWAGINELPDSFGKVVAVAAEVYRGIHRGILRNGYDNMHQRARTSFWEKVRLGLRGHLRFARRKRAYQRARRTAPAGLAHPSVRRRRAGVLTRLNTFVHAILLALAFAYPMASSHAQPDALAQLRSYYLQSAEDETYVGAAQRFIDETPALRGLDAPVVEGYRAALTIMRAKHTPWPVRKLRYLNEGLPVLDTLLSRHPAHLELRYLRLLSCYYLPGFLKRGWSVDEDFDALVRLLPGNVDRYPPGLYETMVRFVMENGTLSEPERTALKQALDVSLTQAGDGDNATQG